MSTMTHPASEPPGVNVTRPATIRAADIRDTALPEAWATNGRHVRSEGLDRRNAALALSARG